jgi:hypothetical protein
MPAAAMRRRRAGGRGKPRQVFGEKERADDLEPGIEDALMGGAPRCHGVGQHDRDADKDHRMMGNTKGPRGAAGGFWLQDVIEPLPAHASL